MNKQRLQILIEAWRDDCLTLEQAAELSWLVREAEDARRIFRAEAQLHGLLHCVVMNSQALPTERPRAWERRPWLTAVAAAAMVAALALMWYRNSGESTIATVNEIHGSVEWNNGRGSTPIALQNGENVFAGTIVLESDEAFVQLKLNDGTLVSLTGSTELNFSDDGRKRLLLRSGTLSAEVKPQRKDRPMLVRTSAAEVEVLGTQFTMDAESTTTALSVKSGCVSLKRLIDGEFVKVNAKQSVFASFDTGKLEPAERAAPPLQWATKYETPPSTPGTYAWLPANDGVPARLQAIPFVAGRRKDDSLIIHYGVNLHSRMNSQQGLVTLDAKTVVRFRYRLKRETRLVCFLCCKNASGQYAGNYAIRWPVSNTPPDAGGWRWAELPLSSALAFEPEKDSNPVGTQVKLARIHSNEVDAGLEISEAEIGTSKQ